MKKVNILGVKIDALTHDELVSKLDEVNLSKNPLIICTTNTEFVMNSQKDGEFKNILNNALINLPDGFGILWAAKFNSLKTPNKKIIREFVILLQWISLILLIPFLPNLFKNPIPERIAGSDFIWDIAEFARKNKYRVFLLGGAPTIAERTALELQTKFYELIIAGVSSGSIEQTQEIISSINKSKADILLVAFGSPKQEKWLTDNLSRTHCKLGIGVGGSFDFISGTKKRAPFLVQKSGLEWLYRLILEPSRIRRQLSIPRFMLRILLNRLH